MIRNAYEYNAMKWLDENLTQDTFLVSEFRSNALIPRPFLGSDYISLINNCGMVFVDLLNSKTEFKNIILITKRAINFEHPLFENIRKGFLIKKDFNLETRNPFNRNVYSLYLYKLKPETSTVN